MTLALSAAPHTAEHEDRGRPHSLEAERAVLGAILLDNALIDAVAEVIHPVDFYRDAHRRIFDHALKLHNKREPIDLMTLRDSLNTAGDLDSVGGPAYISALIDGVPRRQNIESYAAIVREKATLREMVDVANRALNLAYDAQEGANVALDAIQQDFFQIAVHRERGGFVALSDVMFNELGPKLEDLQKHKREVTGIASGLEKLDSDLSGFQNSDLILIGARPAMGKTSLAMQIAKHASTVAGKHVGVFSLEMPREQLGMRLLMNEANVDGMRLRKGFLSEAEWSRVWQAMGPLAAARMHIDDTAAVTIHEVRNKARRMKALHGLDLIVIDYLQLMRGDRSENRNLELGQLSAGLKGLAKELNIPVIALSQLSRALESRSDKHPQLSDLRESGSLEQDADVVLLLYRDEVYNPNSENRGTAEIMIAKHRNGGIANVTVGFDLSQTRFFNLDSEHSSPHNSAS